MRGTISLPVLLYARTGDDNNQVLPEIDLLGRLEVVDRFFFVEAAANVHTLFFSPAGARSSGLETDLFNRYTSQSYSVSPYIQGETGNRLRYLLRDDNLWTDLGDAPGNQRNIYTNLLRGSIDRDPIPLGWGFDVSRNEYRFEEPGGAQILALARARASWQPSATLRLQVSAGYERNEFPLTTTDGAIYGVGVFWQPTERTKLDAAWEHRFFGSSYRFLFEHRTPRTSWNVQASRNITSYPEQLANLPAGGFVPGILNALYASRIPDPTARAEFIDAFMQEHGLTLFLTDPVAIFAQQVYLQESASASVGLLGARNSVLFGLYYLKTEPITAAGEGIPPLISSINDSKQIGARASWAYQLAPLTSLTLTGVASRSDSNPPLAVKSDHYSVQLNLQRTISPRTFAHFGARYQSFKSDFDRGYDEAAVFVGASHTFQ